MTESTRQTNLAARLLNPNLQRHPDKVVYLCDGEVVSYQQLAAGVYRCAEWLRSQGVRKGDRILIVMVDSPVFSAAFLASNLIGAVPAAVSTLLTNDAYQQILDDSEAAVVLVSPALAEMPALASATRQRCVCGERLDVFLPQCAGNPVEAAELEADDLAFMFYTSGSTGRPKGVPHRHADLIFVAESYAGHILEINPDDRILSASKMNFAYGLFCSLVFPLYAGASAILHPALATPQQLLDQIDRHQPNLFFAVPTIYAQLIRSVSDAHLKLPMRFCGSAGERLPAFVLEAWQALTGLEIFDAFGSSETCCLVFANRPGVLRPGSAGTLVPGSEVRLIDDSGRDVPDGKEGHLIVRSPSAARAYWRQPEKTAETMLADGFLRTGDILRKGDFYFHLGRSDDMMKVGGQYVSPVQIEEVLRTDPAIADCAVVACRVNETERPAAYLVRKAGFPDEAAVEKELRTHVEAVLPAYMRPLTYTFLDDLPRNASGKVQRFKLRQLKTQATQS